MHFVLNGLMGSYAFPPSVLIQKVLLKAKFDCHNNFLLIVPFQVQAPWYPFLNQISKKIYKFKMMAGDCWTPQGVDMSHYQWARLNFVGGFQDLVRA